MSFISEFILPFILVTVLYIINIVFLSGRIIVNAKLCKILIVVVNIIALCLSIVVVLLPMAMITMMSLGTGITSISEIQLDFGIVMLMLLSFCSFIYFIVTNIVLTILTAKKQFHDNI